MSQRDNNGRLPCDQALLLQAEFDGELDAAESLTLTAHRETCLTCRLTWHNLQAARRTLRRDASYHPAPVALRQRLEQQLLARVTELDAEAVSPAVPVQPGISQHLIQAWQGLLHIASASRFSRVSRNWRIGGLSAVAATLLVLLALPSLTLSPAGSGSLAELVVASHLRSLQGEHLFDIASNDQHNVKPWFDGKIDFAPPVKNLADQGYPLAGGRLDYLRDRDVAALIYRAGPHVINVLVWPAAGPAKAPQGLTQDGLNLIHWREGEMAIWAVSDLDAATLRQFVTLWRAHN